MRFTTLRRLSIAAVLFLVIIGLIFSTGTGTISSLGWREIATICPLGAIEVFLAEKTLLPRALIVLGLVIGTVIVLGKVFCAWVCPIPSLRRLLTFWKQDRSQKPNHVALQKTADIQVIADSNRGAEECLKGECAWEADSDEGPEHVKVAVLSTHSDPLSPSASQAHSPLRHSNCTHCASCTERRAKLDSRHVVLGGALLSTAIFGFPVFCILCPVGLSFATLIALWRWVGFDELTLSLLAFPAILLIEILVLRKWCLKWCPLGAVMSLMSLPNRLLRPKIDQSRCLRSKGVDCSVCVSVCEERLDPHFSDGMHECTKCGRCVDSCPAHAISIPFKNQNKQLES